MISAPRSQRGRHQAVIQTLAGHAAALRKPVRLLLLERQRWDRDGLGAVARPSDGGPGLSLGFDGRAEWFLRLADRPDGNDPRLEGTRFEDGLLALERLEETDLVAIVRRIAGYAGAELAQSDRAIAEQLQHIDGDGRPLYAYFLGQALADGTDPSNGGNGPGWHREDLLNATLDHPLARMPRRGRPLPRRQQSVRAPRRHRHHRRRPRLRRGDPRRAHPTCEEGPFRIIDMLEDLPLSAVGWVELAKPSFQTRTVL